MSRQEPLTDPDPVQQPVITVVGSTMVDMISYVDKIPAVGETLRGLRFALGFGGKGANQAVMAALLGGRVAIVNRLGDDMFAQPTIENFRQFGVDVAHVEMLAGRSSGVAPIWVEADGMNRIIIVPGANEDITPNDVDEAFDSLPDPDVVLCQLEIPLPAIHQAFLRGKASGAINILNPAPAGPIDSEIVELATWMIPNEVEFGGLAHGIGLRQDGLEETVRAFRKRIKAGLVVTLGGDGAILSYADEPYLAVPAKKVKAVDTTGAGDAFVGAFAYSLAIGVKPTEAVELASACAASSVTRPGTQTSFPRGEELLGLRRMIGAKRGA